MNDARIAAAREQLAALKRDYRERTRALLQALAVRLREIQDLADLDELENHMHRLAGSGGSFGFTELSREARAIETLVRRQRPEFDAAGLPALADRVESLGALLDERDAARSPPGDGRPRGEPGKVLLWMSGHPDTRRRLDTTLAQFGHALQHVASRGELHDLLAESCPEAVLVDADAEGSAADAREALFDHLGELRSDPAQRHWLLFVFSREDGLPLRLQAARAGASGYFTYPFDPVQLVDRLERLRQHGSAQPGRVLLVDDDALLARHHAAVLETGGFETRICTDPLQALDAMEQFGPDMVLLDMHMPGCSGPELARVIRTHDAWLATPLVFLSAETDLDMQLTAASEGADDFLTKPISDGHLVAAVRARVERARELAQLIDSDSLTGLLKHGRIKESLVTEINRAQRGGRGLAVVMLDIDHFKRVNDRFGHPVGDQVLRALGNLLRQRARKSDRVGRYGGEEFMLVLPDCSEDSARTLVEDIRERFRSLRFTAAGEEFQVTLSAGIACYPRFREAGELLARSDAALYAAKQNGRNRVEIAASEAPA